MYFWSDLKDKNLESVYSKDILLANIKVYILTKSFNSASCIYHGRREEGGRYFSKEFKKTSTWPPKFYLDHMFNIKQLTKMLKAEHYAALEQPDLLIEDIVKFNSVLK